MEASSTFSLIAPARRTLKLGVSAELKAFREFLDQRLVGQEEAKASIVDVLAMIRNPIRDPNRMIASFIMAGPSTVGKTRLFKLLVEWVNGDKKHMMFFSGSEYEERHQIQNLIGAPHGYIGFEKRDDLKAKLQPGQEDTSALLSQHNLNNSIIGAKSNVVFMLFDEWEKFNQAFNRFMLRPLREGTGQLNNGAPVGFQNVVCGFTSNIASEALEKTEKGFGFNPGKSGAALNEKEVRQHVVDDLIKFVPQEFRNRIDQLVIFRGLREDESLKIVDVELEEVQRRIAKMPETSAFTFNLDETAKRFLLKDTDPKAGEDTKNRVPKLLDRVRQYLELPLGNLVLLKEIFPGDDIDISYVEGSDELTFTKFEIDADLAAHLKKADVPATVAVDGKSMAELADSASSEKKSAKSTAGGARTSRTSDEAKPRRRSKTIFQTFCVRTMYETLDELLDGRDDVDDVLESASEQFDLRIKVETANRAEGYLEYWVEAPVEALLWVKKKLKRRHGEVIIVGGEL